MAKKKKDVYVRFPAELLAEIDLLAGPRSRSAFLAALVARRIAEMKRERDAGKPVSGQVGE